VSDDGRKLDRSYQLHSDAVSALVNCADDVICAAGWDGVLFAISLRDPKSPPIKVDDRPGRVLALAHDTESSIVAVAVNDSTIAIYV